MASITTSKTVWDGVDARQHVVQLKPLSSNGSVTTIMAATERDNVAWNENSVAVAFEAPYGSLSQLPLLWIPLNA
jgi:hypothetical protein